MSSRLTLLLLTALLLNVVVAVRKAKLYYLRERTGKSARIKERLN